MKTRKFLALALALIMAFAMIPVASLAENVDGLVNEAAAMRKLDNAWAALDAAEADALAQGMSRTEVINAVYTAALNLNTVDKDSFSDFTKDGFYFTVDGMYCAYNYRLRNELNTDCAPVEEGVFLTKGNGKRALLRMQNPPTYSSLLLTTATTAASPISISVKHSPSRQQPVANTCLSRALRQPAPQSQKTLLTRALLFSTATAASPALLPTSA